MEVPICLQNIILHTGIMYCMNLCHSNCLQIVGFILVATFILSKIGICISLIVLLLVLLLEFHDDGCCMAWVVFSSIGCCDWWYACSLCTVWVLSPFSYLFVVNLCPFMYLVCLVLFCIPFTVFLFLFWSAACFIVFILVLSAPCHLYFAYDITWFDICLFCIFDITWCMCYGGYKLSFGGGLILLFMYHHLCLYLLWSI